MAFVHKILVPTDFSETSSRALDHAIELARAFAVPIVLTHAYATPMIAVPDGFIPVHLDQPKVLGELETGLGRLAVRARDAGVAKVEIALVTGQAWREILRVGKDYGCDLIVMGTHGRGGLAHLLLGSVAETVVRRADCPVLTVGPHVP